MLALTGAFLGLLLGYATMQIVVSSLTAIMPLPIQLQARPDLNVTLVTAGFAILSTFVFGLLPALKLSKRDVVTDLKDSTDGSGGRNGGGRTWLVVAQIAVCFMLMVAGGLFGRLAVSAGSADPGYRYDDLFLVSVDSGLAGYNEARGRTVMRDVLERFRSIPGVDAVGMNSQVPFGEFHEGQPVERPGTAATPQSVTFTIASSDYFKTLGMHLLRGREFTGAEDLSAGPVAIIDEPLARMLFGNEDPLGQMIRLSDRSEGLGPKEHSAPREIIGVVPGIRDEVTDQNPRPHLYVPVGSSYRASMNFYVRSRAGASESEMLNSIRREVRAADPKLPILDLMTMRGFHERGLILWALRAAGRTLSTFGIVALVLATVGVYGLKSYLVSRRTREIGIRIALGARPQDILWLVLRDGARTTLTGLLIGFPLAIGLAMLLRGGFVGVRVLDPVVMLLAPTMLLGAAAVATYVPARRAMRVTPLDALRTE
jgi:predicted permease